MGFIKRLFGGKPQAPEPDLGAFFDAKCRMLERALGPMATIVGHAIVPLQIGGAVDLYYYPNALPGTAFATMEVVEPGGGGPILGPFGHYEFVAFTRLRFEQRDETAYQHVENRLWGILTAGTKYSRVAALGPRETVEIPGEHEGEGNYVVLDEYQTPDDLALDGIRYRLLLVVEVFRSEMEFARQSGVPALWEKLDSAGYFPYSDLDRQPVV